LEGGSFPFPHTGNPAGYHVFQLREIDVVLDLSFVPEVVAECYSANRGRPSIDPELALRMMLLGVLFDPSDRELCDEIQMHAGMRWFCGLNFHDPVLNRPGFAGGPRV